MIETSVWEATTVDGRHVRIERDGVRIDFFGSAPPAVYPSPDYRVYVDGEPIDPTGLTRHHKGDRVVIVTSIGELEIAG